MEHLALEIFDRMGSGSKFAMLPKDTVIPFTRDSEIFGSGDVWSLDFRLNVYANAHIFGTAAEIHGGRLHEQINKRKAMLWVDGVPLLLGYLLLDDEVDVSADGDVSVRFEGGMKTFEEKIEGAKANQVPMMGNVRIGVALWRKRTVSRSVELKAEAVFDDKRRSDAGVIRDHNDLTDLMFVSDDEYAPAQQYPRMVFPSGNFKTYVSDYTPGEDFDPACVNTDSPYRESDSGVPLTPFCHVALCYQKYDYIKTDKDGHQEPAYNEEPVAQRGYEYMPANRVNSAPNFFVLYWLRCLMNHLGIYIEENQMMDVEDLRRLFFVNTNCAYKEPKRKFWSDGTIGWYVFSDEGRLVAERFDEQKDVKIEESAFTSTSQPDVTPQLIVKYDGIEQDASAYVADSEVPNIDYLAVGISKVNTTYDAKARYERNNRYLHDAYATSECFPNADISEVLSAIENGFGVRILFSSDYKRVRIVLLRNLFRDTEVQEIKCEIADGDVKIENSVRGFRMSYGDKKDDTDFYYKGFDDMLPHKKKEIWPDESDKHDYSHWELNADYAKIISKISAFDKTCYVTPNTGDAFGIKVDKLAKRLQEQHQSLFEYAGYMDVEEGDCTGEEETIKTVSIGFTPAIMNDLSMEEERQGKREQRFALFVDETMRPRRPDLEDGKDYNDPAEVYDTDTLYDAEKFPKGQNMMHGEGIIAPGEFAVNSDMFAAATGLKVTVEKLIKYVNGTFFGGSDLLPVYARWNLTDLSIDGHINECYRLYLQDNYEPNDTGVSPIETHDWGLTLGIMRGSGSDAYVDYMQDPDDGEGNDTWSVVPGTSVTAHPDTCDSYGNLWDYNGADGMTLHCHTSAEAISAMRSMWGNSNIDLVYSSGTTQRDANTYISNAAIQTVDNKRLLFATALSGGTVLYSGKIKDYAKMFRGMTVSEMFDFDRSGSGFGILVEVGSSMERMGTLLALQKLAFGNGRPVVIDGGDNGIGVTEGRFSLKLRAEKPNPYFDPAQPEDETTNRRYLEITNPDLRGRGLCDQFYKEYSYWIRNARIVKRTVWMELAQLLAIDMTKRVRIGDVTGFVRKMSYSISNETGLGAVTMEIMYI